MALLRKPRLLQLLEVAIQAEALGLRLRVRRYVRRVGFSVGALVFGILVLLGLHVAIWAGLARLLGPVGAALGVAALDLALCLGLGWMAFRRVNDPVAQDASTVRVDALRGASDEVRTLGGLLSQSSKELPPRRRRVRVYPDAH